MRHLLCSILFLLLVAGAVSCRQEKQEEHAYDLSTSQALLAIGEQLLNEPEESPVLSPEFSHQLEETSEGRQLTGILQNQRLQRELIHEANLLLATERYNDLAGLLERAQREDLATSQLLELAGLPQAFQALRLFCARRPYERAADLEQNLDFLRPWARQLQTLSPTFQAFYQEQQQQLMAMRQQEAVAAEEHILRELDRKLASAKNASQATDFLGQAANEFPQLPILQLVQRIDNEWHPTELFLKQLNSPAGFLARASTRERLSLELAIALIWNKIGLDLHQRIADEWKISGDTISLTGTLLRAVCLNNTTFFENGIRAWQDQASPDDLLHDAPSYLPDYLKILLQDAPATSWQASAPDFATTLSRFLENTQ